MVPHLQHFALKNVKFGGQLRESDAIRGRVGKSERV